VITTTRWPILLYRKYDICAVPCFRDGRGLK